MEAEEKDTPPTRKKPRKYEDDVNPLHKLSKQGSSESVSTSGKHRKHHKDSSASKHKERHTHEHISTKKIKSNGSSRHSSPNPTKRDDEHSLTPAENTPPAHKKRMDRLTPGGEDTIVLSQHHHLSKRVPIAREDSTPELTRSRDLEGTKAWIWLMLAEEVEKLEELFVDDAEALFHQFDKAFGEVTKDLRKPNVLLTVRLCNS